MIISIFDNKSGFFSMFFFFVNQYIYAHKNNKNLIVKSENWLFKYKQGWEDYFNDININEYNEDNININCNYKTILGDYKLIDYKNILNKIYIYNDTTQNLINKKKEELGLIDNNYCSIFIRRGDKLIRESNYIETKLYLEYLLSVNNNYNILYLQTDDYNCYLELKQYINDNNINIKLITLCNDNNKGGMIVFDIHKNSINKNEHIIESNRNYISKNIKYINNLKCINEFNNEEIYEHTLNMLIGLELVLNSSLVVTDYSSNGSRFIKLKARDPNMVYDIVSRTNKFNFDKNICPSFSF
jgi:hypothetical protein